jgi:hypothetical protein
MLERPRARQRDEAIVAGRRVLDTQVAQVRQRREVVHPVVGGCVHGQRGEPRQIGEWLQAGGGDRQPSIVEVQAEEPVEAAEALEPAIGERAAQAEIRRRGHVAELLVAALPGPQRRPVAEAGDAVVGQLEAAVERAEVRLAGERADRAVAGPRP